MPLFKGNGIGPLMRVMGLDGSKTVGSCISDPRFLQPGRHEILAQTREVCYLVFTDLGEL